jgi:hypothetical protein
MFTAGSKIDFQVEAYAHGITSPLLIVKASNSPYYMSEEVEIFFFFFVADNFFA